MKYNLRYKGESQPFRLDMDEGPAILAARAESEASERVVLVFGDDHQRKYTCSQGNIIYADELIPPFPYTVDPACSHDLLDQNGDLVCICATDDIAHDLAEFSEGWRNLLDFW